MRRGFGDSPILSRADDTSAWPPGSGRAGRKNSGCRQPARTARQLSARCGGQKGQSIERAGQSALLNEFAAALAEPARQLQARIIERTHVGEALAWCASCGGEEKDGQRSKFAGQVLLCTLGFVWSKCRSVIDDRGVRISEGANFRAGSIDLDVQIRCGTVGIAKLENVLPPSAVGMPPDGVGCGDLGRFRDPQGKSRKRSINLDPS